MHKQIHGDSTLKLMVKYVKFVIILHLIIMCNSLKGTCNSLNIVTKDCQYKNVPRDCKYFEGLL